MAREEMVRLVNIAMEQTGEGQGGTLLSQRIFELASRLDHVPSQRALLVLKEEVRRLF
jgi:hypothetical protein